MELEKSLEGEIKEEEQYRERLCQCFQFQLNFYNSQKLLLHGFYLSLATAFAVYFLTKLVELLYGTSLIYFYILIFVLSVSILFIAYILTKTILDMREIDKKYIPETQKYLEQIKNNLRERRKALKIIKNRKA